MLSEEEGYLPGRRDDLAPLFLLLPIAVGLVFLYTTFFAHPTPPPPAAALKGCFVADIAPSLRFDGGRLDVGQPGFAPLHYRLALAKYGTIDIVTDEPVSLEAFGKRYVYDRGEQRTIVFGRLAHQVQGKSYGVIKTGDAEFIEAQTAAADDVHYAPAPNSACARPDDGKVAA